MAQVPARARGYTPADLWPPGSQGNVPFPPAAFFPVYVGNFRCEKEEEMVARVQEYFASKGLLVRMVFTRDRIKDPYRRFQKKNMLYDCLAYFVRREDANDAIDYLHRDLYFGHRLNVFSGRFPACFDPSRSVHYGVVNRWIEATEQVLEKDLARFGARIVTIVKHSTKDAYVEFSDRDNMESVIQRYNFCHPNRVKPNQMAQRFLEGQVQAEISSKPMFMRQMPSDDILNAFYNGVKPEINEDWHESKIPKVKMNITGKKHTQTTKQRTVARKLQQHFGLQSSVADHVRLQPETIAGRALRKVEAKAHKKGLCMGQWRNLFPGADQVYLQTAAEDWRAPVPYVRYRELPDDDSVPYTYDDLYNLGLKFVAFLRSKHRY